MTKVYIILDIDGGGDQRVHGVFSTQEKAEAARLSLIDPEDIKRKGQFNADWDGPHVWPAELDTLPTWDDVDWIGNEKWRAKL